ncbi:MAG: UDP-3-O-(3-hydroxymyristoyl)glucosamine N-acyltransferase [Gammaproteobacteria bacterium RIFCSPHIGHO2_12_FULL_45_12]|nr:MAG: UDP-3-O-(3-hydroxymyristoyl)glucosamine N-acyltransferase [Gammaproteobacteria bacterium RIFCSPHIGHO2_12_FULL_45_12]
MKSSQKAYSLLELIQGLNVTIKGDPHCRVTGVASIQQACAGHLTFLTNSLYRKHLLTTEASAVIVTEADAKNCRSNALICQDPHFIYAKIAEYFVLPETLVSGIHPTAVIGKHCQIDASASVGANCVLGDHVVIGANVRIGAGCLIGDGVQMAEGVQLDARVTLYRDVVIGQRSHLASGVVVGADGFGFAVNQGTWYKVPQLGSVEIGEDVDIGANTTIDCGATGNTVIGDGVKLDNQIQVAHNVRIGAHTIIAGCVAIAGSTVIGKHCMVGGGTCFAGHVIVCDEVMITGMTAVTKSILTPGIYSSGIVGAVPNHEFRKNNARFHRMESLIERVKALELQLKKLEEREKA